MKIIEALKDILTDGDEEYELLDITCFSDNEGEDEEEEEGGNQEVLKVINARLEQVGEAVNGARAELETKEKMVEDTLNSLRLSSELDGELEVGGLTRASETAGRTGLTVSQHWVRLLSSELVLVLRLTCHGSDSVTELSVNLELAEAVRPLQFRSDLLSLSSSGSVERLGWELAGGHQAYLLSVLQLSSVVSASSLAASVSYTAGFQAKITNTLHIDLPATSFLSRTLTVSFGGREDTVSYLSLYVTGTAETVQARTALGTFSQLVDQLINNDFIHNMTIGAYVFTSPGHILHQAVVSINHVSNQEIVLNLLAPDFTKLGLLVKLLKRFLPVDTKFARVTKSSSQ